MDTIEENPQSSIDWNVIALLGMISGIIVLGVSLLIILPAKKTTPTSSTTYTNYFNPSQTVIENQNPFNSNTSTYQNPFAFAQPVTSSNAQYQNPFASLQQK